MSVEEIYGEYPVVNTKKWTIRCPIIKRSSDRWILIIDSIIMIPTLSERKKILPPTSSS